MLELSQNGIMSALINKKNKLLFLGKFKMRNNNFEKQIIKFNYKNNNLYFTQVFLLLKNLKDNCFNVLMDLKES